MNVTLSDNEIFKSVTLLLDGVTAGEYRTKRCDSSVHLDVVPVTVNFGDNPLLEQRVTDLEAHDHFNNIIPITLNEAQTDYINS